jgi:hypothetical protein
MRATAGKIVEYKLPDGRKVPATVVRDSHGVGQDLRIELSAKDAKALGDRVVPAGKGEFLITNVVQGDGDGHWSWGERQTPDFIAQRDAE